MNKQKIIAIIIICISVILAVISWILLPETVITQISLGGGNVSTMPKAFAVIIPTALSVIGGVGILMSKKEEKTNYKMYVFSGAGMLVFALMLIINLA